MKEKLKTFSDQGKLKEYSTSRPIFKKLRGNSLNIKTMIKEGILKQQEGIQKEHNYR